MREKVKRLSVHFPAHQAPSKMGSTQKRKVFAAIGEQTLSFCVEVLRPSQPNGVMSSAVSLPNHMFTGQA